MYKCMKCKKEFQDKPYINYGFRHGKTFCVILCNDCRNTTTEEQIEEQIKIQTEEIKSHTEDLGILGN